MSDIPMYKVIICVVKADSPEEEMIKKSSFAECKWFSSESLSWDSVQHLYDKINETEFPLSDLEIEDAFQDLFEPLDGDDSSVHYVLIGGSDAAEVEQLYSDGIWKVTSVYGNQDFESPIKAKEHAVKIIRQHNARFF